MKKNKEFRWIVNLHKLEKQPIVLKLKEKLFIANKSIFMWLFFPVNAHPEVCIGRELI